MMEGSVRPEPLKIETWRISLPNVKGQGWAIIFMDSTGCFAALSDYGNVSYRWSPYGLPPGGFKRFVLTADDHYLMSKFGQNRREYDPEATYAGVKEHILQYRRDGSLTKEQAREEWDALRTYEELRTEFDFSQWYSNTSLGDAGEFHCQRYESEVTGFVKYVMPRLREHLRQELGLTPEEARVE